MAKKFVFNPLTGRLDIINAEAIIPTAPSVTLVGTDSGIHEVGETVAAPLFTATTVKHTNDITLVEFYKGLSMEHSVPSPIATGGTETFQSLDDITSNESWSVKISDGILNAQSNTVSYTFIQPYFRGKVTGGSKPTADQTLLDSGTKVLLSSVGTITVNFNSGATDWIWFAIPAASTSKVKRYVDILNNGAIGGPSNLFGDEEIVSVDSPTALWNGVPYKFYVANYQSGVVQPMEFRNS